MQTHFEAKLKCTISPLKGKNSPKCSHKRFPLLFDVIPSISPTFFSSEIKFENEQASRPMLKPTANVEMLVASEEEEEEEAPKLQLLDEQESSIESSRSVTPDM